MVEESDYSKHQRHMKESFLFFQTHIPEIRLFERHVGMFKTVRGNPLRINKPGMFDSWFIIPVANSIPLYGEIEYKTGNSKLNKDQKIWKAFLDSMHVPNFVCRDKELTLVEIKEAITRIASKLCV